MGSWGRTSCDWRVGWEGSGVRERRMAMCRVDELGYEGRGQECGASLSRQSGKSADLLGGVEGAG